MNISLEWLSEYIDIELGLDELSSLLTNAGLEIEGLEYKKPAIEGILTARIEKVSNHPDSEKLKLCNVSVGADEYKLVCGDSSIKVGEIVPIALPGYKLPDGSVIKKTKVRGADSEGMLCSEKELGLSEENAGVMRLPEGTESGKEIGQVITGLSPMFGLNASGAPKKSVSLAGYSDSVFEVGLTPNRSDCLSILGVARELSALTGFKVHSHEISFDESTRSVNEDIDVIIEEKTTCSRYTARVIKRIKVAKSPLWLRQRLESAGVRPINNVVDVTNYVLMEMGQPLHAFDLARIEGGKITVRKARKKEFLKTLDGIERTFCGDELLIADNKGPLALAGIMGGLDSSVTDGTTDIVIESAHFIPETVRKTSRKQGIHSESSHRFERGVDLVAVPDALDRAAMLISQLAGGKISKGMIDSYPMPYENKEIRFRTQSCSDVLGIEMSADESLAYLRKLNMEVTLNGEEYLVVPPPYRVDIEREIDLIEEVARLKGYSEIPVENLSGVMPDRISENSGSLILLIKRFMADSGFNELINYTFQAPGDMDMLGLGDIDPLRDRPKLINPISEELSLMRSTLISGMLNSASFNLKKQNRALNLFELGKVFRDDGGQITESRRLSALITGDKGTLLWKREGDIYDIKGVLENLLDLLNIKEYNFVNCSDISYLHPGRGARVFVCGKEIALIGEIHPSVTENFDLRQKACIFDLNIDAVSLLSKENNIKFSDVPPFPFVERDMALMLDKSLPSNDIMQLIGGLHIDLIENIDIFDQFEGEGIEDGKKSLAIRFRYRSSKETLTDEKVNEVHNAIVAHLVDKTGAILR
ncbi:MAG: phenylalanine--tRNA ligase subunit beta [bacterium]|nr:phenylalanine--tRNA ligase subunit beta [bacterium]